MRKRTARQSAAQAARGGLGAAIPEPGWDCGSSGRAIGKYGAGKKGEFGQALTGFGGVNELTSRAKHLLGGQGQLLHGPAIRGEGAQHGCGERQGGAHQQGLPIAWIVDGDHSEGGTLFRCVGAHQVIPELRAQYDLSGGPGLYPIERGGRDGPPFVTAGQRTDQCSTCGRSAAALVGGRGGAAERAVLGQAHHIAGGSFLLQQRHTEAGIKHQRVIRRALRHSGTHQEAGVRAGARVRSVRTHESQRQGQTLALHPAHPRDQTDGDGGQRLARLSVVVCRWTVLQPGPPEGGHVHSHGVVAPLCLWLPLPFGQHLPLPPRQQELIAQSPCPSAAHARRTARSDRLHALRPGITAPRVVSNCPLTSIHSRCSMPRFVPTGKGATKAQINVNMRYTAWGTRSFLRLSTASASALYQRVCPTATPLPETRALRSSAQVVVCPYRVSEPPSRLLTRGQAPHGKQRVHSGECHVVQGRE